MWDPTIYRRFGAERSRPFFDLTARVDCDRPRASSISAAAPVSSP